MNRSLTNTAVSVLLAGLTVPTLSACSDPPPRVQTDDERFLSMVEAVHRVPAPPDAVALAHRVCDTITSRTAYIDLLREALTDPDLSVVIDPAVHVYCPRQDRFIN